MIGGCLDSEFSLWSNGLFEDFKLGIYVPVISEIVVAEIAQAPDTVIKKYSELLDYNLIILELSNEVIDLANSYLAKKILSENFLDDARHIAFASVYEVDLLVSWNFKHIVHYDKIRMFNSVNLENGYKPINIYSPREVTKHGS
ncbi:MAG: type II toxin-antitoxin system VapC family toxin [Calditrichaceae bacterium]|nr:type II toxin-antitoxin system VapC family toxin [Calditrichaceae bacterium]MBN2709460.1 type II toxin-antitoxin system VapC family toxin [Calditrichaceae bacterium]RQV94056.1 MAG: PIN domain protein [Calditrichota bacterium]